MNKAIIKATHSGSLKFGDIKIPCFVLADGRRVISGRAMTNAIGMKGRGQGAQRISTHKTLKPFINNELDLAIRNPIQVIDAPGSRKKKPISGYEATILHDLCQIVLKARDAGQLKTDQEVRLIFELNKWPYNEQSIKKRPGVIGRWTDDTWINPDEIPTQTNHLALSRSPYLACGKLVHLKTVPGRRLNPKVPYR